MQVFLYEFFSGGGMWSHESSFGPVETLLGEGAAMAAALAGDLARIPGVHVALMRDSRLTHWLPRDCAVWDTTNTSDHGHHFQRLAQQSRWTVVIAPEFDEILLRLCRDVLAADGHLLGPEPETVELASDKSRTCSFLNKIGIRTPAGQTYSRHHSAPQRTAFPAILKPCTGAGSLGVQLIHRAEDLPEISDEDAWRLEQYCPGVAASVAWIAGAPSPVILEPCFQKISDDGQFRYLGGSAPMPEPLRSRARGLAERVATAIDAARGFLGVDVVLHEQDRERDTVVEINPRLTSSYIGLRRLSRNNLAEAMLATAEGRDCELRFSRDAIEFGIEANLAFDARGA